MLKLGLPDSSSATTDLTHAATHRVCREQGEPANVTRFLSTNLPYAEKLKYTPPRGPGQRCKLASASNRHGPPQNPEATLTLKATVGREKELPEPPPRSNEDHY